MNINEAKVGMRVKLVYSIVSEWEGREGTIRGICYNEKGTICGSGDPLPFDTNLIIIWDGETNTRYEHSRRVEPILPPNIIQEILDKKELPDEDCPLFQFVEVNEKDAI